jgi:tetratricopeptide (TPR) repeat protein
MPSRSAGLLADAAEAAFDAGDGDGALRLAERAAAADATGISALLRLGELWERRGEPDQATRAYRRADELAPRDGRARLRLAELDLSRGDVGRAGATFRELTGGGASADLARDAGRRALDLVQLGADGGAVLDLAVARMRAAPDLDESRELLLDALERAGESTAGRWRTALAAPEQEELRRMLLAAASRGPVSHRQRAAGLLASLALPGAARDLLATALSTSPPREATRTVQEAYSRARLAMVLAVGRLREPSAVPELVAALDHPDTPTLLRRALSWSLLHTDTAEARRAVFERGIDGADAYTHALACHALAASRPDPVALRALGRARSAADAAPVPAVRHACQYAVATLLDDGALRELLPRLDGADPLAAAIVAHRVGSAAAGPEAIAALVRRWLGPSGLARDATATALGRLRAAASTDHASPAAAAPTAGPAATLELPAVLEDGRWPVAFEGALRRVVTEGSPVTADDLARTFPDALAVASAAAARGTRAERVALHERLCTPEVGRACPSRAPSTTAQPTGRARTRGD